MKLKAGIVGCGNISKFYFAGLEKNGIDLKWACDIMEQPARSLAEKHGAKYTANYTDIVKDEDVDVIFLTCLTSAHKKICMDAIDAKKPIICEKTLGQNSKESLSIVEHAIKNKTVFYTAYMKRFIPAVEKAHSLLPKIGKIISTHIRTYQPWGDIWGDNPAEGFFHTPADGMSMVRRNYGGGILTCGGSHILDLILFFLGRPSKVYASIYTPKDRDYELQAAALMETSNGTVHFEALAHPHKKIGFMRDGWDEEIKIVGTQGILTVKTGMWDQPLVKASSLVHYDNTTCQYNEYVFDPVSPFERLMGSYCKTVKSGKQEPQTKVTGYEVDELIDQIKKSASSGKAITIEWRI